MLSVLDTYYPETSFNKVRVCSEWINSNLFELMTRRDYAYEKASISKLRKIGKKHINLETELATYVVWPRMII